MGKKFLLHQLGGGPGYTLEDTDLWGLLCALIHGQEDGYFEDNKEWAEGMLDKIRTLRGDEDNT